MRAINEQLTGCLRSARTVALCSHVNPDGDTVGSVLALRLGLIALGKEVRVFCQDKVPDNLRFLQGADLFETEAALTPDDRFDAVVPVDVSSLDRMGRCAALLEHGTVRLLVDHHGTNPHDYVDHWEVDGSAPACALLVKALLDALGCPMTAQIAECLYTGLSTDTGNFSFSSTSEEAFTVMAELMRTGFDMSELNRHLFRQRAKAQLLLIRAALNTIGFRCGGRLAVMQLTQRDFDACGALQEHADTVVNFGLDVEGVCMSVLGRECPDGKIKFSLRGIPGYAVDKIAQQLGGGGHGLAAGITFPDGTLEGRTAQVTALMEAAIASAAS